MKRHLLGIIIALLLFALGLLLVLRVDECKMPWAECDAPRVESQP